MPRLPGPLRGTGRGAARDCRLTRRAEPKHAAGAPARPSLAHAPAVAQGPRAAQGSGGSVEDARMRPTAALPDDPRLPGLMAIRDSGLARAIPALGLEQGGGGVELVLCGYHPGARATLDARVGQRRFAVKTFADDPTPEAALYQALGAAGLAGEIGRASCRERVEKGVVAVASNEKKQREPAVRSQSPSPCACRRTGTIPQ